MKMLLAIGLIVGLMAISGLVIADDGNTDDLNKDIQETSRGIYTTSCEPLTDWLNNNDDFYHTHNVYIPTRRHPLGVGADVVLFESQNPLLEAVTAEYKYDFNNDEHSAYGVVRVNAYRAITNMFKK